jgi:hypothetical protein
MSWLFTHSTTRFVGAIPLGQINDWPPNVAASKAGNHRAHWPMIQSSSPVTT